MNKRTFEFYFPLVAALRLQFRSTKYDFKVFVSLSTQLSRPTHSQSLSVVRKLKCTIATQQLFILFYCVFSSLFLLAIILRHLNQLLSFSLLMSTRISQVSHCPIKGDITRISLVSLSLFSSLQNQSQ